MPTDKKLNNLIINYLTEEQYKSATKNEDELYLTPDVGGNEIETIDGTWDGDDFTLSKTPTSFPFMARLTMAGTNNIAEVYFSDAFSSSEENIKIGLYNDAQSMYVFLYYPEDTSKNAVIQHPYIQGTNIADKVLVSKADKSAKWQFLKTINSQSLLGEGNIDTDIEVIKGELIAISGNSFTFSLSKEPMASKAFIANIDLGLAYAQAFMQASYKNNVPYWSACFFTGTDGDDGIFLGYTEYTTQGKGNANLAVKLPLWKKLDSYQEKTYLHTITAIGATLSISFTYPSANNLVVDSAQDASTVIKPTANEYFPAPVVVIATNKLSDACNCVYYNGTIWKFAMWNGTEFANAEVVTAWQDSVVAVD